VGTELLIRPSVVLVTYQRVLQHIGVGGHDLPELLLERGCGGVLPKETVTKTPSKVP
jgi:hypothetical protein